MQVKDSINERYGHGAVRLASENSVGGYYGGEGIKHSCEAGLVDSIVPCGVVRRTCKSEGGTPLSRQYDRLPCFALALNAHAVARGGSKRCC